jgi:deazaflavin-dependent oxidoreductase (nitroreductase family)
MATHRFRPNFMTGAINALINRLLKLGINMGPRGGRLTLLTVRGRTSGEPRTTPVSLTESDGRRFLVSTFGEVNWVRNLRAVGTGTIGKGRHAEHVRAVELPAEEAAEIIKRVLAIAPGFTRAQYDVTPSAPFSEFVREARRHPVFEIFPSEPHTR